VLASLSSSITSQIASHGVYAVFLLMALGAVFPIGSELVALYAGALASGVFSSASHVSLFGSEVAYGAGAFVVLALAGTLGYFVGALVGWTIGRYGGRPLLERHGRWLHVTPQRLDKAEAWFQRWGNAGVLVGEITPLLRSFVPIPAGVFETPFVPFALMTLAASAIWSFAIGGIGYALGASYERFQHDFRYVEIAILAGVLVLAAYLLLRVRRAGTVRRRDDPAR
jgi:membrane protein DedA with SNARE-associated domain